MKKLIIDRKRWIRGESNSCLLRESDSRMCCLGFYSRSCRIPASRILNKNSPADLCKLPNQMKWLAEDGSNTMEAHQLIKFNDNRNYSLPEREAGIKAIFAKHDVEVTFIN